MFDKMSGICFKITGGGRVDWGIDDINLFTI